MNTPQILQQLARSNPQINQVKSLMGIVRNANNPGAMLNMVAQNNPQLRQAMDFVRQYGNDPKQAFYAACQQRGVDPQDILNVLK